MRSGALGRSQGDDGRPGASLAPQGYPGRHGASAWKRPADRTCLLVPAHRVCLEGLAAGLAALEGGADAAYLSSCDVPFLQPAFVRRLITLLGDHLICVPRVGDFHHPLAAIYRLDAQTKVVQLLAENRLRPFFLFDSVPTRIVEASELADVDPTFQTLRNLNTPEEYEAALREASAQQTPTPSRE